MGTFKNFEKKIDEIIMSVLSSYKSFFTYFKLYLIKFVAEKRT